MKAGRKKTFEVTYVMPETEEESQEIRRIIKEVRNEKLDSSKVDWEIIDNRPKSSTD